MERCSLVSILRIVTDTPAMTACAESVIRPVTLAKSLCAKIAPATSRASTQIRVKLTPWSRITPFLKGSPRYGGNYTAGIYGNAIPVRESASSAGGAYRAPSGWRRYGCGRDRPGTDGD